MCLGVPGEVVEILERHGLRFARVRFGGVTREVCLEYEPEATLGDYVLVHVGFAISTIDRQEARRALAVLQGLGEADEDGAPAGSGGGDLS